MPELPEVETVRRGLEPVLCDQRIVDVEVRRPDLRIPFPLDFARRLAGRRVTGLRRRAKYLLIDLDDAEVVICHLGMSGNFLVRWRTGSLPGPHDHVVFTLEDGNEVVFNDQRRFGLMTLVAGTAENDHPLLRRLAPDPLDNSFTSGSFLARLAGRRTPVKAALLNQEIVGGVGNIYASESLHQARISPRRLAAHIGPGRAAALADALGDVLRRAIAAGGSSLRDHVRTSGEPGYFQHDFRVYGRENDPCPTAGCAGIIRRIVQSGRSTYLCGHCQR
ncbi:MAG: bifunctional DNA-formamidopyrimidine glycosylase/DNA-(apurinic or apyrimidinic site) lyase [bacterium]|nr:bifunctional DNA-formamidopyrimidine glycosylase/DNA-(apurinic or apyrimidinic site) lyase [bacterium]